jgi:hypothetical protein
VAFDLPGGSVVGRQIGADGVVDVFAGEVEEAGSGGDFGDAVEQDFEVVGRHGEDVVSVADEVGRGLAAGVFL